MSSVIKAAALRGGVDDPQVVTFSLADLQARGESYVTHLRQQAAQIVAQARTEAEGIRRAAQEQGQKAALAAAEKGLQAKLDAQVATVLPALKQAAAGLEEARHAWLRSWETNVVRLATAIAGRIVRREIAREPQITLDLIREALELACGSGRVRLHLHPSDQAALGEQAAAVASQIARLAPTEIVADASVAPGGCRVTTDFGEVDMQVASQLKRIEEELIA